MAMLVEEVSVTQVRAGLKRIKDENGSRLSSSMYEWYLSLEPEKKAVVEQHVTTLINNYHRCSRNQFGPMAALEVLGLLLLADLDCRLVDRDWWTRRWSNGRE